MDTSMKSIIIGIYITIVVTIRYSEEANILAFYPFPGVSHHKVYWPVLRELALRGHNVTMVTPFTMKDPPAKNYREIKVPDYSEECRDLEVELFIKESHPLIKLWKNAKIIMFREMGIYHVDVILQDPVVQWLIKSDSKFDLILGEFTFAEESFIALSHRFKASYIELTSFGNYHWANWIFGNPYEASYIGDISTSYSDRMDFMERLHNTAMSLTVRLVWYYYYNPKFQQLADKYIRYPGWEQRPPIIEMLSRNTSLYLMNTHHSLNYPYPLAAHVKEIGGVNIQDQESLTNDIQEFIDGAKDGFIYFSMGSYMQGSTTLGNHVRDNFIQVFSRLRQRVLWKWETDIPGLPKNIKISKWVSQTAVLGHPNCNLFITHGGFLSLSEAVYQGVPMVSIPIFADQFHNAEVVTTKGIGVRLDLDNLTVESIERAIDQVMNNRRYKEQVIEQSRIFRDKPESAVETAIYWTEYVIRHKGAHHLRPAIATMPWYQQAMLDVYAAIALIIFLPIYLTYKIMATLIKCCCGTKSTKKMSKKQKIN